MCIYLSTLPENRVIESALEFTFNNAYFAISFSLNLLLTFTIVTRLILQRRNIRKAMGASAGVGQTYGAIITILVESSALYAVSFLLFFVPTTAKSWIENAFWPVLFQAQVRAALTALRRTPISGQCCLITVTNR